MEHLRGAFALFLHAESYKVATKLLPNWNKVVEKLDPVRIPCASTASTHPSIKEAALRAAPFCVFLYSEPGEAQGILNGFNFLATLLQLLSNCVGSCV